MTREDHSVLKRLTQWGQAEVTQVVTTQRNRLGWGNAGQREGACLQEGDWVQIVTGALMTVLAPEPQRKGLPA